MVWRRTRSGKSKRKRGAVSMRVVIGLLACLGVLWLLSHFAWLAFWIWNGD